MCCFGAAIPAATEIGRCIKRTCAQTRTAKCSTSELRSLVAIACNMPTMWPQPEIPKSIVLRPLKAVKLPLSTELSKPRSALEWIKPARNFFYQELLTWLTNSPTPIMNIKYFFLVLMSSSFLSLSVRLSPSMASGLGAVIFLKST